MISATLIRSRIALASNFGNRVAKKTGTYSVDKKDTDPYNISPIEMRSL